MNTRILVIGNGYIADNFICSVKDKYDVTVYARLKNIEYSNVTYIYDLVEHINMLTNDFDHIYILFGHSRPNTTSTLNEVIYSNVYLISKILDFASTNMSKIFYPATSLALTESTRKLNYYSYSHTIAIDMIRQSKLIYTICYLHNIYGSLTGAPKKNKMVIDNFIDCYHDSRHVQLINDGIQRRIFTHISDVIDYMILNLDCTTNKEVNLVKDNVVYSVKEIAELLELQTVSVNNTLYSLDDPYTLAIDDLGIWKEQIDIKDWITNKVKI